MKATHRPFRYRPGQSASSGGFTLIEVLVALLVVSIGLLGVARLQTLAMRSTHGSHLRSQAVVLAYAMADRMRANNRGVRDASGNYVGFYNAADDAPGTGDYQAAADAGCSEHGGVAAATCTVAQMAANDTFEWTRTLAQILPDGSGVTCIDATPNDGTAAAPACDDAGDVYAIKVWWTTMEADGPADRRYVMRYSP